MTREIQCMAKGEPDNVTYFRWEHRSIFHEHIRYLSGTNNGILRLLDVNISARYQTTGYYLCNVSNGIPDKNGNVVQQGRISFLSKGITNCSLCWFKKKYIDFGSQMTNK